MVKIDCDMSTVTRKTMFCDIPLMLNSQPNSSDFWNGTNVYLTILNKKYLFDL